MTAIENVIALETKTALLADNPVAKLVDIAVGEAAALVNELADAEDFDRELFIRANDALNILNNL